MATMTEQEKIDWDNLYQYVRKLLGYDETMALPKFMVVRLKGLTEGKFMANKKTKSKASYDYYTIYLTFIYCKDKIQKALQTKKFTNEQNKFNYIMAIVENNINDVVIRLKNEKKVEEKIEKTEVVDYEIKVDKTNSDIKSYKSDNKTFNSLTDNLW